MKYLLAKDNVKRGQDILDNIAEFLWNNGHEVYASNNFNNRIDYLNIIKCCDWIVVLIFRDCPVESIFGSAWEVSQIDNDLRKNFNRKFILVFSTNGVYCNAIPSPHKIFHFEGLCQSELARFFRWCEKLSLFANSIGQPKEILTSLRTQTFVSALH